MRISIASWSEFQLPGRRYPQTSLRRFAPTTQPSARAEGEAGSACNCSHTCSRAPSSADVLSDPVVQPLMAHELYRQAAATRDLARGLLDQSLTAWKQISDNLPSPFNLACYARALTSRATSAMRFSFFPTPSTAIRTTFRSARDLAMFFARLGEIEAADKALEPIRHAFLDERNALAIQQAELDRGLDEEWIGDKAAESTSAALWQEQHRRLSQCNEFHGSPRCARRQFAANDRPHRSGRWWRDQHGHRIQHDLRPHHCQAVARARARRIHFATGR